jgi:hypothetical protein
MDSEKTLAGEVLAELKAYGSILFGRERYVCVEGGAGGSSECGFPSAASFPHAAAVKPRSKLSCLEALLEIM